MDDLAGKVIAVTGAGSGIGRALALGLVQQGAKLALTDKDAAGLAETSRQLGNAHHVTQVFDVTEPGALARFAATTLDNFGAVDGVINNAGLSVVAPFAHTPREDFDRVMAVNFDAVVEGSRVFLPHLQGQTSRGWIVNISSVFGIIPFPTQSAYCASKFAVRGFTETLRVELEQTDPHIRVICVHPGGIKTAVARNAKFIRGMAESEDGLMSSARFETAARTTPERAAETIINAMRRGQVRVRIGRDADLIDWIARLMPVGSPKMLSRIMGLNN